MRVAGVSAPRYLDDSAEHPSGQHHGTRKRLEPVDYLLDSDNSTLSGKNSFPLHTRDPPELDVSLSVGSLRMNDRDVRLQSCDGSQHFASKGAGDARNVLGMRR